MPASSNTTSKQRKRGAQLPGEEYVRLRPGTKQWQIAFRIDGFRVRETSGTEDKAAACQLALKRWNEEYRRIKLGEAPRRVVTLDAACVRYWEEVAQHTSYGQNSQRHQMAVLREILGPNLLLSEIDDGAVSDLLLKLRDRPRLNSPATLNRYLTTLHVLCKRAREVWAIETGAWTLGKHLLDEPEGREVFLEHSQARSLLEAACGHLRPILLLDMVTGMRKGNVLGLQWEHVSLDMGRAVLVQKGNRRLGVTLPEPAVRLLRALEPDPEKRKGPVFYFGNPQIDCQCVHCKTRRFQGQPITSIKRSFATAARAAGLRDMPAGRLRFHDLRHSFASWLLADGGDLKLVQEALGHRQITTTARYSHLLPGRKEQIIGSAVAGLLEAPAIEKEKKAG